MKKYYPAFLLALPTLLAAQVPVTMRRLPDTGQTTSYTNTYGEDSDYSLNVPVYLLPGDGTVLDTVTGLQWQRVDGGEMTVEQATLYCDTLTLGGYTDWRLPTAREGYSILSHDHPNPALDGTAFPATGAEYWWTSEHQANDANKIWVTNAGGGVGNHLKTETISAGGTKRYHARAVRTPAPVTTVASRFTDLGDGTVRDNLTNLIWQKTPNPDSITWEQALSYAENLALAGQSDWRLPNIKELQSITDAGLVNPTVSTVLFPSVGVKKLWSSTSLPNQTTKAWYLDTRFGITTYVFKTNKINLLCVRGVAVSTTAVQEVGGPVMQVFPNPFTDHVRITPVRPEEQVTLYNATGMVVFSGKNIEQVDFSSLPPGIYWLKSEGVVVKLLK